MPQTSPLLVLAPRPWRTLPTSSARRHGDNQGEGRATISMRSAGRVKGRRSPTEARPRRRRLWRPAALVEVSIGSSTRIEASHGLHISDHQTSLYMSLPTDTVEVATTKPGFSTATGYRIEGGPRLPSPKQTPRTTSAGPAGGEVSADAAGPPAFRAVAVLDEPRRRHPDLNPHVRGRLKCG